MKTYFKKLFNLSSTAQEDSDGKAHKAISGNTQSSQRFGGVALHNMTGLKSADPRNLESRLDAPTLTLNGSLAEKFLSTPKANVFDYDLDPSGLHAQLSVRELMADLARKGEDLSTYNPANRDPNLPGHYEYQWFHDLLRCALIKRLVPNHLNALTPTIEEASNNYLRVAGMLASYIQLENRPFDEQFVLPPNIIQKYLREYQYPNETVIEPGAKLADIIFSPQFFARKTRYKNNNAPYIEFLQQVFQHLILSENEQKAAFEKVVRLLALNEHFDDPTFNDSEKTAVLNAVFKKPIVFSEDSTDCLVWSSDKDTQLKLNWPSTMRVITKLYQVPAHIKEREIRQQKLNAQFLMACRDKDFEAVKNLLENSPEEGLRVNINSYKGLGILKSCTYIDKAIIHYLVVEHYEKINKDILKRILGDKPDNEYPLDEHTKNLLIKAVATKYPVSSAEEIDMIMGTQLSSLTPIKTPAKV